MEFAPLRSRSRPGLGALLVALAVELVRRAIRRHQERGDAAYPARPFAKLCPDRPARGNPADRRRHPGAAGRHRQRNRCTATPVHPDRRPGFLWLGAGGRTRWLLRRAADRADNLLPGFGCVRQPDAVGPDGLGSGAAGAAHGALDAGWFGRRGHRVRYLSRRYSQAVAAGGRLSSRSRLRLSWCGSRSRAVGRGDPRGTGQVQADETKPAGRAGARWPGSSAAPARCAGSSCSR